MLQPYLAELVGKGGEFSALQRFIKKSAGSSEPVALLGEGGSGKEVTARSIHFKSRRKNHPFIAVDASLYYEIELERELFGCVESGSGVVARRGLLEFSSRGTCYVSNVEELSARAQERLLNFLETGYIERVGSSKPISSKVRIIVSSRKNIDGFAEGGLFSRPLWDRLRRNQLGISPLREHSEDIIPFIHQLTQLYCMEHLDRDSEIRFSRETLEALEAYPWPGNYDELKAELLRIFKTGVRTVTPQSLAPEIVLLETGPRGGSDVRRVIEEIEEYIQEFRIMVRLDAEYGDILVDDAEWDLQLKCHDRCTDV